MPQNVPVVIDGGPDELTRLSDADLHRLLVIRHFEQTLLELFGRGELAGTTHTCLGQEYVPVAISPLLDDRDWVFSNHRGHGHYLARFDDPEGLLAEIMGRAGAVCAGVGGSQHILRERYLSTGVQGESLPAAVGAALRSTRHDPGHLACVYLGDGTWGEGAVYEALNLAALWRLPVLVVVEHNGIAQTTPTGLQLAGSIGARAAGFGIPHLLIDTVDVNRIRDRLAPRIAEVRTRPGPTVVEVRTHRVGPHSKGDDTRTAAELARVRAADWCPRYRRAYPEHVAEVDPAARARVAAAVAEVSGRPRSAWR